MLAALAFWLLVSFQSGPGQTISGLEAQVQKLLQSHRKTAALWSVSVRNSGGNVVLGVNNDEKITPASNQKILTAAVIFEHLGPEYRFKTVAFTEGPVKNGTLHGNLIVVGSGDPSINKKTWTDPIQVLNSIADSVRSRGINRIEGRILGDNSFFEDEPYPEGWEWKDLTFYYGVEIDALSFNDNTVDLLVEANGPVGKAPKISWYPFNTNYVSFVNRQVITAPGTRYRESYYRLPGSKTILLKSKMPPGYLEKESLSIPDPASFFVHTLTEVLKKNGIDVQDKHVDVDRDRKQVWSLISPPVSALMTEILAKSNNFYTEMLLRTADATEKGGGGSTSGGVGLMRTWVHNHGLDSSLVYALDGSGLYAGALNTADNLSGTLHAVRSKPWAVAFDTALAAPGKYGTLQNRFGNTVFASGLRAKTGYISGVRSLAGYLTTRSGSTVSFALVTNHFTVKTAVIDKVHEEILRLLYENE
jgi:D-alanyl-D-alanine carboxypeptidase/D-alanyl-D-alanine-endopeptidase (penicillin-binding protein 4)